ncbi:hypothetical protein CE91St41_17260 [Oscillospiraceae bacterium]|nr:hypothetical protein CE91St40_20280 [Oscillospiraceae bacterium]BDF74837.1 hypothetical protein CE91St41_17260 [Oscillospiraceae bacterium]
MLKMLGAILLTGGAAALGFAAAGQLASRVTALRALLGALELMERELAFTLPSMPELLASLAERAAPPAGGFFARCARGLGRLGEQSLGEIWRQALEEYPMDLKEDELQTLRGLGDVLGRYDGEGQRQALGLAREQLSRSLVSAEEDRDRQGKVYGALGLTAGTFLVILLL